MEGYYSAKLRATQEAKQRAAAAGDVIPGAALPQEESPHGLLTHVINPQISPKFHSAEAFILDVEPRGYSSAHRHMSEEFIYVLEGEGYDLQWEVDYAIEDRYEWRVTDRVRRIDWKAGDSLFIPVNVAHQHFNSSPTGHARLYCVTSRIYDAVGLAEVEELAPASRTQGQAARAPGTAEPAAAVTLPYGSGAVEGQRERERERTFDRIDGWTDDYEYTELKAALSRLPRIVRSEELPSRPAWFRGFWVQRIFSPGPDGLAPLTSFRCWFEHFAPGACSAKHGHMNEALFYVLEGHGYEVHDGRRYEWHEGDVVIVPPATVHQHFNADAERDARVLVVNPKPTYMFLNLIQQRFVEQSPYGRPFGVRR